MGDTSPNGGRVPRRRRSLRRRASHYPASADAERTTARNGDGDKAENIAHRGTTDAGLSAGVLMRTVGIPLSGATWPVKLAL